MLGFFLKDRKKGWFLSENPQKTHGFGSFLKKPHQKNLVGVV
jgi:hypothetical protein